MQGLQVTGMIIWKKTQLHCNFLNAYERAYMQCEIKNLRYTACTTGTEVSLAMSITNTE